MYYNSFSCELLSLAPKALLPDGVTFYQPHRAGYSEHMAFVRVKENTSRLMSCDQTQTTIEADVEAPASSIFACLLRRFDEPRDSLGDVNVHYPKTGDPEDGYARSNWPAGQRSLAINLGCSKAWLDRGPIITIETTNRSTIFVFRRMSSAALVFLLQDPLVMLPGGGAACARPAAVPVPTLFVSQKQLEFSLDVVESMLGTDPALVPRPDEDSTSFLERLSRRDPTPTLTFEAEFKDALTISDHEPRQSTGEASTKQTQIDVETDGTAKTSGTFEMSTMQADVSMNDAASASQAATLPTVTAAVGQGDTTITEGPLSQKPRSASNSQLVRTLSPASRSRASRDGASARSKSVCSVILVDAAANDRSDDRGDRAVSRPIKRQRNQSEALTSLFGSVCGGSVAGSTTSVGFGGEAKQTISILDSDEDDQQERLQNAYEWLESVIATSLEADKDVIRQCDQSDNRALATLGQAKAKCVQELSRSSHTRRAASNAQRIKKDSLELLRTRLGRDVAMVGFKSKLGLGQSVIGKRKSCVKRECLPTSRNTRELSVFSQASTESGYTASVSTASAK
ncbi:hypothetical protein BCV70DRAFT_2787 [Testicularia cyperi]|uniref:Uncharacterized protein n=1 Tax=Testicularia cyperi TaxID=1882483 RepID=A0A317XWU8_9BASI|nr:hypothetical protein BCV70DRAFT_2787 [Testicularia cyperi]